MIVMKLTLLNYRISFIVKANIRIIDFHILWTLDYINGLQDLSDHLSQITASSKLRVDTTIADYTAKLIRCYWNWFILTVVELRDYIYNILYIDYLKEKTIANLLLSDIQNSTVQHNCYQLQQQYTILLCIISWTQRQCFMIHNRCLRRSLDLN